MLVTQHPPHRPVLALLTHTVPTLDVGVHANIRVSDAAGRTRSSPLGSLSRLSVRYELGSSVFSLASGLPSTASFDPPQVFVQPLRRYYAAARFPAAVHLSLIAHRFLPAVRGLLTTDSNGASRFSRVKFLCMLGVFDSAGSRRTRIVSHASLLPSGSPDTVGSLDWDFGAHYFGIPSLHMPLSNASGTSLPLHPHGSGSGWFATPFPV